MFYIHCVPSRGWKSLNIWENFNNPKFYSGRNKEQTEIRKCLLSFGAESFVFQVAVQEIKD